MIQEQIKDAYTWSVFYDDASLMSEYDREEGCGFADVDQSRVKALFLFPTCGEGLPYNSVAIPQGATPVFFRRRSIELSLSGDEGKRSTTHCIGWKRDDEASYLFIFDDGNTLLTNNLQAV